MITKIRKRDGREVPFNIEKIANAIFKAAQVCGGRDYQTAFSLAQDVASYVEEHCGQEVPTVEFIQDAVEKVLVERGHARTAKEYILYRAERTRIREMDTRLMKIYEDLTFQLRLGKRRQAGKRQHRRRHRHGHHADSYGSEGAKQFNELFILKPRPRPGPRGRGHPHPRPGLPHPDHHLLPDRPEKALCTAASATGHGCLREPNDITSYAALACIAIQCQPERPARRTEHPQLRLLHGSTAWPRPIARAYRRKPGQGPGAPGRLRTSRRPAEGHPGTSPLTRRQPHPGTRTAERNVLRTLVCAPRMTVEKVQAFAARKAEEET